MNNNKKHTQSISTEERAGEKFIIYHNTRCSKSREACSILQDEGVAFETIEYLKTPPTENQLKELLKMLGMKAEEIIRKGEPTYKEKYINKNFSQNEWIKILATHPILIERPIVVKGKKAIIGRPPEKVLAFLNTLA